MIIDCHGHYTTAPEPLQRFREAQIEAYKAGKILPEVPFISDDQIRESIEKNQLKLLEARGLDMTIFSPRASAMAHHIGDEGVSKQWTRACNDLIHRVVDLYPQKFIGVCQLPQSVGVPIENSIEELERCFFNFIRSPMCQHFPVCQAVYTFCQIHHHSHVVFNNKESDAEFLVGPFQTINQPVDQGRIDACSRFIKQQNLGFIHQSHGKLQKLLLTK